jgi:hypothetical protein
VWNLFACVLRGGGGLGCVYTRRPGWMCGGCVPPLMCFPRPCALGGLSDACCRVAGEWAERAG